jgi:Raf kinase inhibitor-like YbhB/YbcL family protein
MLVSSPAFDDGDKIPWRYSGEGCNELPPLRIDGVPPETRSLAVIIEDPDSPLHEGAVTHWLAWNLPPDTAEVDALRLPEAARVGMDSFGQTGYRGPNPPEGRHHYRFRLLALDMALELKSGATRVDFDRAASGHVLAEAVLTGIFENHMDEEDRD